jgi:hypothetical protein
MVERRVPRLHDEPILSSGSNRLDERTGRPASCALDDPAGIAVENAGRVIRVDNRCRPIPGCLEQLAESREPVAEAGEQEIAIFVLEIVEQIDEQEAVTHELLQYPLGARE